MGLASDLWRAVPFVAMISVECTDTGISVISKAALTKGMSNVVSVVYYNALATLILLPYFIFCRFFFLGSSVLLSSILHYLRCVHVRIWLPAETNKPL